MNTLDLVILIIACILLILILTVSIILLVKKGWLNDITIVLNSAIKEAEQKFPTKEGWDAKQREENGKRKQEYVLNAVQEWCNQKSAWMGFLYKAFHYAVVSLIDTIIKHYNILSR